VLFKYIENAVKYGSRTDVQVIIAGAGNEVEFAVRNTGRQIPLDEAAQLFALGFRGSFRASAIPGSGFGLAQVKRIARLLDGAVGYRPVGDDQNEFWLRLPAAAAP
jgi:signal transduction histidine kinase